MWGPRRAPRARARRLRRGRGRARPVLLPPPRRVPRPPGRGGDPRPRERADPRRAPAVRGARGAAGAPPTTRRWGRRWRRTPPSVLVAAGELRRGPNGTFVPRATEGFPAAASRCARRPRQRSRSSTPSRASCSARRARARAEHRARGRGLPARRALLRGRALDLEQRRALVQPFEGDWYTQPKKETDPHRAAARPPRDDGRDARFGTVGVTEQVLAYQKKRLSPTTRRSTCRARPAADVVRHAGALVRAGGDDASPSCR